MPSSDLQGCVLCGQVQRVPEPRAGLRLVCARCGAPLGETKPDSLNRTLAFSLAALLLYIPANVMPIMSFDYYGAVEHNTVWAGVVNLARGGMWVVAAVVFMASIVVPLLKIGCLFFLCLALKTGRGARFKASLYRLVRAVSTWAMLDVFLLSVLVALVKLGELANVDPGPGILPFSLVVVFTLLATESFDPTLLWSHG